MSTCRDFAKVSPGIDLSTEDEESIWLPFIYGLDSEPI